MNKLKLQRAPLYRVGLYLFTILITLTASAAVVPGAAGQTADCTSPYTIQRGDTLSEIAQRCEVTLAELLAANPQIDNPALIYAGRQLTIPGGSLLPDTGASGTLRLTPESGPAGTTVVVDGSGFPANVRVQVGPGVAESEPVYTHQVITDAQGRFRTQVTIPANAESNRNWVIAANPLLGGGSPGALVNFDVTEMGQPDQQFYTIRAGDTLADIAERFNTTVPALVRANPSLEESDVLVPGQQLVIPGALVVIPDTGNRVYVVERGDTLSAIAVRFGTTLQELLNANPDIEDPRVINRGQRIVIPEPVNVIPDTGQAVYTVQRGDTLSEIAVQFRTTVEDLLEANPGIENASLIYTGQRIVIPVRDGS